MLCMMQVKTVTVAHITTSVCNKFLHRRIESACHLLLCLLDEGCQTYLLKIGTQINILQQEDYTALSNIHIYVPRKTGAS